ncbi:MAG: thiamine-phosphate kinase [Bryobacteraceae bacterium]
MRRDGARPGDVIYVSGPLGRAAFRRFRDLPEPRLAAGRKLRGKVSACIDLSDGLSLDLHRLCLASGVAGIIDRVPVHPGATIEQGLHGGEDYELLCTAAPRGELPGMIPIGRITEGEAGALFFTGERLRPAGYQHFKDT